MFIDYCILLYFNTCMPIFTTINISTDALYITHYAYTERSEFCVTKMVGIENEEYYVIPIL